MAWNQGGNGRGNGGQEFDRTNTGIFSRNDRKESEKHPDIKGSMDLVCPHCNEPAAWWIDGWQKQRANDGQPFYSLSLKPKDQNAGGYGAPRQPGGGYRQGNGGGNRSWQGNGPPARQGGYPGQGGGNGYRQGPPPQQGYQGPPQGGHQGQGNGQGYRQGPPPNQGGWDGPPPPQDRQWDQGGDPGGWQPAPRDADGHQRGGPPMQQRPAAPQGPDGPPPGRGFEQDDVPF